MTHPDPTMDESDPTAGESEPVPSDPVTVPYTQLRPDLLHSLVESFVLREGTDYGEREASLEKKVADVIRQIERGEAQIIFDPQSESIDIVTAKPSGRRL